MGNTSTHAQELLVKLRTAHMPHVLPRLPQLEARRRFGRAAGASLPSMSQDSWLKVVRECLSNAHGRPSIVLDACPLRCSYVGCTVINYFSF